MNLDKHAEQIAQTITNLTKEVDKIRWWNIGWQKYRIGRELETLINLTDSLHTRCVELEKENKKLKNKKP